MSVLSLALSVGRMAKECSFRAIARIQHNFFDGGMSVPKRVKATTLAIFFANSFFFGIYLMCNILWTHR